MVVLLGSATRFSMLVFGDEFDTIFLYWVHQLSQYPGVVSDSPLAHADTVSAVV
jgi:hypothetical protein